LREKPTQRDDGGLQHLRCGCGSLS
jgi:hypothetical protein